MRVSNHPSTGPPPVNHSTSLLSKLRWCVPKQVSMVVTFLVFGSYICIWRPLCSIGNTCAEVWLDPLRQNSAVWFGRILAATQTRLLPSIAKLCAVLCAVQIDSSPQYGDACAGGPGRGVLGSRTCSGTCSVALFFGSTTGM